MICLLYSYNRYVTGETLVEQLEQYNIAHCKITACVWRHSLASVTVIGNVYRLNKPMQLPIPCIAS